MMSNYQCSECGAKDWHTCPEPRGTFVQRYAVLLGASPAVAALIALCVTVASAKGAL